jgi:hypothetical protein
MDILELLIETVTATTLMTIFSYLAGQSFRKLFSEPVMLNYVIRISSVNVNPRLNSILGWLLHFLFGLLFIVPYHWIWNRRILDDSWLAGIILGVPSGIIGILGWMVIFSLPREKPKVAFAEYFIQLFFAHIVFALTAVATHKLYHHF